MGPLPPNITVRTLLPSDIVGAATCLSEAPDDGTYYQYPHLDDSSGSQFKGSLKYLRGSSISPTILWRVAAIPDEGGKGEKIVGVSGWMRLEAVKGQEGKTEKKNFRQLGWMECKSF